MKFKTGDRIRRPDGTNEFQVTYVDTYNHLYGLAGYSTDFRGDYLEMAFELVEPVTEPKTVGYFKWVTYSGTSGMTEYDTEEEARDNSICGVVYKVVMKVQKKVVKTETWEEVK